MKALVLAFVVVIVVLGVLILNSLRYKIAVENIWQSLKSKSTDAVFTPATIADFIPQFKFGGVLVNASNENITRSSIGRLAGEYGLWLPPALLPQNGVSWCAIEQNTIQATLKLNNEPINLKLIIDTRGKILKLSFPRWGESTEDNNWQYILFGEEVKTEQTCSPRYSAPSTTELSETCVIRTFRPQASSLCLDFINIQFLRKLMQDGGLRNKIILNFLESE